MPAGVTDLGDLKPSPYLLYGGFSPDSFGTPSAVAVLNPDSIEGSPLGDTGAADGISGLAFDSAGHLLASTLDGSFGSRTSRLSFQIDPDSGSLIAEIGSITDGPGGTTISVAHLATQPATGSLFALRSGEDGLFQAGKLYTLEPATGVATLRG